MADNVTLPGTGQACAADEVVDGTLGTVKVQYMKLMDGALDSTVKWSIYVEDVAAASDPVGPALIAVRRDTLSTSEVSADGDNIALKATSKGKLHAAAELRVGDTIIDTGVGTGGSATPRFALDSSQVQSTVAHDAVDAGDPMKVGGFAKASAPADVSADSDRVNAWFLRNGAQAAVITAAGALIGGDATFGLDVDVTRLTAQKAEDVASADADVGIPSMAVQKATPANTAGTDGDYEFLQMSAGRLWASVKIDTAIPAGANVIGGVTIAAGATNVAKAEDVASADADVGIPSMAVQKATPANTAGTDGDYEFLQMSAGRLWASVKIDTAIPAGANVIGGVTIAAGATSVAKAEDVASADADVGIPAMVVRKAAPANSSGTDGDYEFLQASGGYLWVHDNKGLSNLVFTAAFTTLTRPANTTPYAAADSISDNATAGSVTALSATVSDVNDDPIFISEILINSTDTGLAGKKIRAYLFNADPTASSGVGAGDNVTYSQKKNGYIGSFMGWMETGFSDGCVGRLVPTFNETNFSGAGAFIPAKPTGGAKTLYIQYQAVEAFTPSANSTTIIGTAKGWQGRAA